MTNMDLVEQIKAEVANGFSKKHLEILIGLPENSLSGVIAGTKKLSTKSKVKVEKFMASEKPDPLKVKCFLNIKDIGEPSGKQIKIQDFTKGNTNQVKPITEPPQTQNVVIKTGEREPKEGSMAFFSKYGVSTYAELNNKKGKPKQ